MEVDETQWPLVLIDVHQRLPSKEVDNLLLAMGRWLERGPHVVVLHSHTPSALGRESMQRMKRWQDTHRAAFEASCRGMGFVTDHMGPVRSFAVSVMTSLMGKMTVPITFHSARQDAIEWANKRVNATAELASG